MYTFLMWMGIVAIIGVVLLKIFTTCLFDDRNLEGRGFGLTIIISSLAIGCSLLLLLLEGE